MPAGPFDGLHSFADLPANSGEFLIHHLAVSRNAFHRLLEVSADRLEQDALLSQLQIHPIELAVDSIQPADNSIELAINAVEPCVDLVETIQDFLHVANSDSDDDTIVW